MFDFCDCVIAVAIAVFLACIAAACVQEAREGSGTAGYHYEYIDTQGNEGVASSCDQGRNYMYCRHGDQYIQVTQYTKVMEEE